MIAPATPADEAARLGALIDLAVLDTDAEERFDRLTRLAARILDVPIALVSLIDRDRQWFKSRVGLDAAETPREISFCGHAIHDDELFVVPDAQLDERFHDNPLVLDDPSIRFYAGRPLRAAAGERIGTLCVIDRQPRELSPEDRQTLDDLASLVERELQQRTLADAWDANRILQARYQAIFENVHESISLIRPGEGWILGNDASDRMLGYPEGTTRLDNRPEFVHPDDLDVAMKAFGEVAAGVRNAGEPWLVRVRAADDSYHWFESTAKDLRDDPAVEAIVVSTRDVTDRIVRSQQHQLIVEHSPLGIWTLDESAHVDFVNERFAALLGYEVDEMVGQPAETFYMADEREAFRQRWSRVAPGKVFYSREMRYRHRDGHEVCVEVTSSALHTPDGIHRGSMAMFRDRALELELEARAAVSERRYELLFEHSSDVISVVGSDGTWKYSSPAGSRLLGYAHDHRPEGGIFGFIHPDDVWFALRSLDEVISGERGPREPVTFRVLTVAGETRWFESSAVNLVDEPLIDGIMVVSRDVTEREELMAMLAHAAGHDPLTDLLNRGSFTERLESALARAARDGRMVAACFVDLDLFKPINDTYGHQAGDDVLISVAARLAGAVRAGDVAARLGGDEFVVLCEQVERPEDLRAVTNRLVAALNEPHDTCAGPIECRASIGVAFATPPEDAQELLARADAALYRAKGAGRGQVVYFDDPAAPSRPPT